MKNPWILLFVVFVLSCSNQKKTLNKVANVPPPNIIFMVGDGMGLAQISMAIEHAQDNLTFSRCQHIGFIKTSSLSHYITDSAAGATAFSTGKKTYNKAIAVDVDTAAVETIFEIAEKKNWLTGLVVTCSITHATPAAFFSHQPSRYLHKEIANDFYSSGVDIAIGGGKPYFESDSLKHYGYQIANGKEEINNIKSNKWIGFFNDSIHPPRVTDGRNDFLPLATKKALYALDAKNKPFFLLVEGSQIDWGGHNNDASYVTQELLDFDQSIRVVLEYIQTHPNTLLVITADHETGGLSLLADSNNIVKPHFSSGDHSGIIVPVFAFGKGAEKFTGIYENNGIFDRFKSLMN
jgi:alkaline phosphatase